MAITERAEPYVNRLIEDRELQRDLRDLASALRGSYGRAEKKDKKPSRLLGDRKFKQNAQRAGESLRNATMRFRGEPPKKSHRLRKLLMIAVILGAAAFAGKKLLDAESEAPATPPPPGV
jgi:hypothetical protein